MGNKESQFAARYAPEGVEHQALDPTLIKSFTDLKGSDADVALDKFQIVRILSNLRQYRLLSGLYEKAVRLNTTDRPAWLQFALALASDRRFSRVTKILQQFISLAEVEPEWANSECAIVSHMQLARIQLENMGDFDLAEIAAIKAINLTTNTWLSGRCHLLLGMVYSMKARRNNRFELKRKLMADAIKLFETAIDLDPHDDLAHMYCALEYANSRNLETARERCQMALQLNMDNPFAIMLMALIFTAKKDFKGALSLVINALSNFPSHYGLLVLRLKLESKYGRVEEALQTSRSLIYFWRKTNPTIDGIGSEEEGGAAGLNAGAAETASRMGDSTSTLGKHMSSREAMVPLTPLLTAPLGITTPSAHILATSTFDAVTPCSINDTLSTFETAAQMSELGAPPPSTDSQSILTSSSKSWISFTAFRIQADIWVELAEFFIELDRAHDVQACVEEACAIYPQSHQALYLKGHLYLSRSEKCQGMDPALASRLRDEARNCFLGALSMCPSHCLSYALLSKAYHVDGNLEMAEKMLRELMAIDPLDFQSWHELGKVLMELGRDEEALDAFQTAGSLAANTPLISFQTIPRVFNSIN